MSIARLKEVAARKLPFSTCDFDEVHDVRVLMTAGLLAGLRMRVPEEPDVPSGPTSPMVRVLAITPDGRRLLRRCDANAAAASRPDQAVSNPSA